MDLMEIVLLKLAFGFKKVQKTQWRDVKGPVFGEMCKHTINTYHPQQTKVAMEICWTELLTVNESPCCAPLPTVLFEKNTTKWHKSPQADRSTTTPLLLCMVSSWAATYVYPKPRGNNTWLRGHEKILDWSMSWWWGPSIETPVQLYSTWMREFTHDSSSHHKDSGWYCWWLNSCTSWGW